MGKGAEAAADDSVRKSAGFSAWVGQRHRAARFFAHADAATTASSSTETQALNSTGALRGTLRALPPPRSRSEVGSGPTGADLLLDELDGAEIFAVCVGEDDGTELIHVLE